MSFNEIKETESLAQLMERSKQQPVILFKHSTACPISARAYREMQNVKQEVDIVIVQHARELSRAVETATGVRHETPQAILLRHEKPVWTSSHYDISAEAVEEAMRENT